MKQRNHKHPVTDALGRLNEDAVHACMAEDIFPHATTHTHSRLFPKLAIAAACLAVTAVVGTAALLPLLRPHAPTFPGTSSDLVINNGEQAYPFVRLQVLSYDESESGTDIEDESAPGNGVTIDSNNYFRNSNLVLRFDCAEGESVTITSHNAVSPLSDELANTLAALEQLDDPEGEMDAVTKDAVRRKLERKLFALQRKYHAHENRHGITEVDDFTYMWNVPQNPKEYEIIDFTISDAEGDIIGAGSICVGIRHAFCLYQLRTAVLGSERFEAPISQEEAEAYLESLHATANDAYADMDFTPNNDTEGYALARSTVTKLLNADYPDPTLRDSCHYGAGSCDFQWYTFNGINAPETMRRFFLFSDGTYVEVAPEGATVFDGMLYQLFESTEVVEEDFSEITIPLTDGRILQFQEETYTDPVYGTTHNMWVARMTDASTSQGVI